MKKPDRKAFQREYGPRAAAKYVTAMRKYRKFLKNQPKPKAATPKTEPKAAPKTETKPKVAPKPETKPKTETKPRQTTPAEAKSRFFSSSSGTYGQNMPSMPKLKSQPTKPSRSDFPSGRSGASAYSKALRAYRSKQNRLKLNLPKVKRNRRGRPIK